MPRRLRLLAMTTFIHSMNANWYKTTPFKFLLLLLFCALGILHIPQARATNKVKDIKEINAITPDTIERFVAVMTALSTDEHDLPPPDVRAWLESHLHRKSRYTTTISYDIPGYPEQEKKLLLKKEQFIESIMTDSSEFASFETTVKIENIKIIHRGQDASFHTVSDDKGTLYVPDANGGKKALPFKGASICNQRLTLSHSNVVQLLQAKCITEIHFNPFGDKELDDYDF